MLLSSAKKILTMTGLTSAFAGVASAAISLTVPIQTTDIDNNPNASFQGITNGTGGELIFTLDENTPISAFIPNVNNSGGDLSIFNGAVTAISGQIGGVTFSGNALSNTQLALVNRDPVDGDGDEVSFSVNEVLTDSLLGFEITQVLNNYDGSNPDSFGSAAIVGAAASLDPSVINANYDNRQEFSIVFRNNDTGVSTRVNGVVAVPEAANAALVLGVLALAIPATMRKNYLSPKTSSSADIMREP